MNAVDNALARVITEAGDLELAYRWAEGEARALYGAACIVLAHPELATEAEIARARVLRDQFDVMFAGFLVIADAADDMEPSS